MKTVNRRKKFALNTITSVIFQGATIFSGLVLPRLYLIAYGSDLNGLYHSIIKFLSLISLMEFGIGAVIQSNLYKPIAERDKYKINCIITSGSVFYRKIAFVLLLYICALVIGFSFYLSEFYSFYFIAALIFGISIGTFARYLFGAVDQIFLNASQCGYIFYTLQSLSLILNLAVVAIAISFKLPIYVVCFISSLVYLARPFFIRRYINRYYTINRKEKYSDEPIKQKWNGMAQHFAYVVLEEADTIILTLFSSLAIVSIYGIYNSVVMGIKQLINAFTRGAQSLMGDMIAKKENEKLAKFFAIAEYGIHSLTVLLFSCVSVLIVPFVTVYTKGVEDANYIQPYFAALLVLAYAIHTLRTPYNMAILAAGHYKQTQKCYIVAAIINLVVSIMLVRYDALIGVAAGTVMAMVYQTVWMAKYTLQNIIEKQIKPTIKQFFVDVLNVALILYATAKYELQDSNFICWIQMGVSVFCISLIVILVTSVVFYRENLIQLKKVILSHCIRK